MLKVPQEKLEKPQHIAIVMDGNGRWAKARFLPRMAGHKAGATAVKTVIKCCVKNSIQVLTLFAFSSENWSRPPAEVENLMQLFLKSLQKDSKSLSEQNVQLRFIGDRSRLDEGLQRQMTTSETAMQNNSGLVLLVAVNYGGQWDILNAAKRLAAEVQAEKISLEDVTLKRFSNYLATGDVPPVDLFIRTSGEQRISNFLLWQAAYAEIYFSPVLWPDFDAQAFDTAMQFYAQRERRFGFTGEQIKAGSYA
jgi:undecaprenyl diphosphate synthase